MASGHRHHAPGTPIDPVRQHELEMLLAHPQFVAAVKAYDREDCDHDIPFVGGSGTDWRTIFWDRQFCAAIKARRFLIAGRPQDPRPVGKVHEAIEGAIIHLWELARQLFGWPETQAKYPRAHDIADVAEHHAALERGWNWDDYQNGYKPFIRMDEREQIVNPPPNLLLVPYIGTPLYGRLATLQIKARRQHAPRRPFHPSMIGARQAPDGKHYLPDKTRPGKYLMVVPHAG